MSPKTRQQILREMADQFGPVFEHSPVGVYLYVDDYYKICNERMARMQGMTVEERKNALTFLKTLSRKKTGRCMQEITATPWLD